jgi:ABC-2 type transport system permease protein
MAEEFGNDTFAGYTGLLSPYSLVDGVMAGPFGAQSVMATPPHGVLMSTIFCLVAVAIVVGCYAALVARYRKALS